MCDDYRNGSFLAYDCMYLRNKVNFNKLLLQKYKHMHLIARVYGNTIYKELYLIVHEKMAIKLFE